MFNSINKLHILSTNALINLSYILDLYSTNVFIKTFLLNFKPTRMKKGGWIDLFFLSNEALHLVFSFFFSFWVDLYFVMIIKTQIYSDLISAYIHSLKTLIVLGFHYHILWITTINFMGLAPSRSHLEIFF